MPKPTPEQAPSTRSCPVGSPPTKRASGTMVAAAARLAAAADARGPISSETRREKNSVSVMQTAAIRPSSAPTASVCRRLWRMRSVLPSRPLWRSLQQRADAGGFGCVPAIGDDLVVVVESRYETMHHKGVVGPVVHGQGGDTHGCVHVAVTAGGLRKTSPRGGWERCGSRVTSSSSSRAVIAAAVWARAM